MNEFELWLRSIGLRPRTVAPDGKWRRCPTDDHPRKRNGAYKLFPDGRAGVAQDWATMDKALTWRADGPAPDEFDRDAHREAMRELARNIERDQARAVTGARDFYQAAKPLRDGHPYLASHKLGMTGCVGLRVDAEGWLVVPAWDVGHRLTSVQRIAPDGRKLFWPGAPVAGTFFVTERVDATLTLLCEGLATGLACYEALPEARVIVAWNAGNMTRVPIPPGFTVVVADNDAGTAERIGTNPGIEAALAVAKEIGCGVAYPTEIEGTDWCDYLVENIDARMARKSEYMTEHGIRRIVLGEIRQGIKRHAKLTDRRTP